jgi:hypothetical protein
VKAILEFSLPEDSWEYKCATHGAKLTSIVSALDEDLRSWQKYGHSFESADEAIKAIRESLLTGLIDGNISLE